MAGARLYDHPDLPSALIDVRFKPSNADERKLFDEQLDVLLAQKFQTIKSEHLKVKRSSECLLKLLQEEVDAFLSDEVLKIKIMQIVETVTKYVSLVRTYNQTALECSVNCPLDPFILELLISAGKLQDKTEQIQRDASINLPKEIKSANGDILKKLDQLNDKLDGVIRDRKFWLARQAYYELDSPPSRECSCALL